MEALQGRWVARAATCEALQEALQARARLSVVFIFSLVGSKGIYHYWKYCYFLFEGT